MRADLRRMQPMRGLALIAVLWIVAALTILVTGMSYAVRDEVRQVSGARHAMEAGAIADGAIQLVLQEMLSTSPRPTQLVRVQRNYQGQAVDVEVMPLNGLIDLNNAPQALLAQLFTRSGEVDAAAATALAEAVVAYRSGPARGSARNRAFEAPEDLLLVQGVTYPLYASISALVTADAQGNGRVNAMAAPLGVLLVLADGNVANVNQIASARDAGRTDVDMTTALNGAYLGTSRVSRFRILARVGLADGRKVLVSRTVDLEDGAREGLPWRTLQMQRSIEAG